MGSQVTTVTLAGQRFVIMPQVEYERLRAAAVAEGTVEGPPLPEPDAKGRVPAVAYARASLARKIIRRRRAAGLTQADLARRAGIRPETLNRLEKGKSTPSVATVDRITAALASSEPEQAE